jgi:hypothetical protein
MPLWNGINLYLVDIYGIFTNTKSHLFPGNSDESVPRGLKSRFSGSKVTSFRVQARLKSPVTLLSVTSFRVISLQKVTFYPGKFSSQKPKVTFFRVGLPLVSKVTFFRVGNRRSQSRPNFYKVTMY